MPKMRCEWNAKRTVHNNQMNNFRWAGQNKNRTAKGWITTYVKSLLYLIKAVHPNKDLIHFIYW